MTVTPEAILATVAREAGLDPDKVGLDSTLEGLDIGSLDLMSILFALEDEFDLELIPENIDRSWTVGAIRRLCGEPADEMSRRVVITGMGCVSGLGRGVEASWAQMLRGEGAIRDIDRTLGRGQAGLAHAGPGRLDGA
ncbi:MAG: phosphopantetheine-binding protein [Sphingomonas sp.]